MATPPSTESSWRRGLSDANRAMHSLLFWVADAIGSIVVGTVAAVVTSNVTDIQYLQIVIPAGVSITWLAMFAAAFIGWNAFRAPYRQRNELRSLLSQSPDELDSTIARLRSQTGTAERDLDMATLLDEQADRLANGVAIREIPASTQQELQRFVAELRISGIVEVFELRGSNACRLTDFGTKVVDKLREPDEIQGLIEGLSDGTKRMFQAQAQPFRQGRVSRGSVNGSVLEELRRAGILEVRTVDAGWWSRDSHKGTVDFYYLTDLGGQVLEKLCQEVGQS